MDDETPTARTIRLIREEERDRCIKLLCPHCAVGRPVQRAPGAGAGGYHVLEEIQGHAYHTVECMAEILRLR